MSSRKHCYTKYGNQAALLALVPGLAHFRSRQYLVGLLTLATISILLLWVCWLALLQFGSGHSNLAAARACFLFWTFVVWQASVVHAYHSAIRKRQELGVRQAIDLAVQIADSSLRATTRNVSKTGACLVTSDALPVSKQLTIALDGHPTNEARVVWSRPTGEGTENVVGVEFARPARRAGSTLPSGAENPTGHQP